jgi:hypothetical protein
MDINNMLAELRTERENLERAIVHSGAPGGRPWQTPGPPAGLDDRAVKRRGRPPGSTNKPKAI